MGEGKKERGIDGMEGGGWDGRGWEGEDGKVAFVCTMIGKHDLTASSLIEKLRKTVVLPSVATHNE